MKIIDILNKIANGEEPPKKILYKCNDEEYIFEYDENNYDYENEWGVWLFEGICFSGENHLNKEVEILETTITYYQYQNKISQLQSEIDILTNKAEHYYSEVVSFRDKTRYLKEQIKELQRLNKE